MVYRLDRLARSTRDLLEIAEQLPEAGAGLRSLRRALGRHHQPGGAYGADRLCRHRRVRAGADRGAARWTLNVRATSAADFPPSTRRCASRTYSAASLAGRPKRTPRRIAAALPAPVRAKGKFCATTSATETTVHIGYARVSTDDRTCAYSARRSKKRVVDGSMRKRSPGPTRPASAYTPARPGARARKLRPRPEGATAAMSGRVGELEAGPLPCPRSLPIYHPHGW